MNLFLNILCCIEIDLLQGVVFGFVLALLLIYFYLN